jgi:hypothetical protein
MVSVRTRCTLRDLDSLSAPPEQAAVRHTGPPYDRYSTLSVPPHGPQIAAGVGGGKSRASIPCDMIAEMTRRVPEPTCDTVPHDMINPWRMQTGGLGNEPKRE